MAVQAVRREFSSVQRPLPCVRRCVDDGDTNLHLWSYNGDYDKVLMALLKGEGVNTVNNWKQTPLHLATSVGKLEIMLLLLDSGAQVNARDHQNLTPLHQAVIHGNKKSVELLLCCNASPHNAEEVEDTLSPLVLSESLPLVHKMIEEAAGKVPSLLHLCRLALRKMMGVTRRKRMRELPLPQQLTSYLSTLPLTFSEELFPDAERKRPSKSSRRHPKPVPQTSSVLQHLRLGAHI